MTKKKSIHYVDNTRLYEEMVEYKRQFNHAKEMGLEKPTPSNFIGQSILNIANHVATLRDFAKYYYVDEMIGDGIENVFMYLDRFDPEKSKNPFSYFTQIIWYAYWRRMAKEKKQWQIKQEMVKFLPQEYFEQCEIEGDNVSVELLRSMMGILPDKEQEIGEVTFINPIEYNSTESDDEIF